MCPEGSSGRRSARPRLGCARRGDRTRLRGVGVRRGALLRIVLGVGAPAGPLDTALNVIRCTIGFVAQALAIAPIAVVTPVVAVGGGTQGSGCHCAGALAHRTAGLT